MHKSTLIVEEWHFAKVVKTYNCLVFSTNLDNNSLKNRFLERTILGHKCILNLFNQVLSTNYKGRWFLTIKRPKFFKNFFCYTSIFLERFFSQKTIGFEIRRNISSLFRKLFFIFNFQRTMNFFFKLKNKITMIWIEIFFQCWYTISCVIYD